jgi:hypothetical protein
MESGETAFVGKVFIEVGDGASPEVFNRYCNITDISGFGEKNDQVEVTTFCSGGVKEFIPGLSEGQELSLTANYALEDSVQEQLISDVKNKVTRNFKLIMGDDSPVSRTFDFALAMLSYEIDPSVSKQNGVKFTGKQTGQIVETLT